MDLLFPELEGIANKKRCSICGVIKESSEFHKNPKSLDGLDHRCKLCRNKIQTDRRKSRKKNNTVTEYSKRCSKCKIVKPPSEFRKKWDNNSGLAARCIECARIDRREQSTWRGHLNEFGEPFTTSDKDRIFKGYCDICETVNPSSIGWCVDHDHETSYVRGILCSNCNTGANWDTVENWCAKAGKYLTDFQERLKTYPLPIN